MILAILLFCVAIAVAGSLLFSSLTDALRDFSRPRLQEVMEKRQQGQLYGALVDHADDLIFLTAVCRLIFNMGIVICIVALLEQARPKSAVLYLVTLAIAGLISLFSSVSLPEAIARYTGESLIASCGRMLQWMRWILFPLSNFRQAIDAAMRRATHAGGETETEIIEQEIEDEIRSVVEEGEKEGVVDEQEREMIESVIEFRDSTVTEAMTTRPDIVALELTATLSEVKHLVETSGHSRIPVFDGSIDKIVGILYARDLLKYLGETGEDWDIHSVTRPAFFVPESKPLKDLFRDFRLQKVHIAIVLDEYGGTAGLVTIEDILEQLVGEISDEHEPIEPAMLKQVGENNWEVDARTFIEELNRVVGLNLPEDAGYDTVAGFVTTTLGRIPTKGTAFEHPGARFIILDAEPQRVKRVRIELTGEGPGEGSAVRGQ